MRVEDIGPRGSCAPDRHHQSPLTTAPALHDGCVSSCEVCQCSARNDSRLQCMAVQAGIGARISRSGEARPVESCAAVAGFEGMQLFQQARRAGELGELKRARAAKDWGK